MIGIGQDSESSPSAQSLPPANLMTHDLIPMFVQTDIPPQKNIRGRTNPCGAGPASARGTQASGQRLAASSTSLYFCILPLAVMGY